jgi:hypothetical protein
MLNRAWAQWLTPVILATHSSNPSTTKKKKIKKEKENGNGLELIRVSNIRNIVIR